MLCFSVESVRTCLLSIVALFIDTHCMFNLFLYANNPRANTDNPRNVLFCYPQKPLGGAVSVRPRVRGDNLENNTVLKTQTEVKHV